MRASPSAFFQDDMKTLVKSGTLVAEELDGGLGYSGPYPTSEEDPTIVPAVGSLSVGTRGDFNVGYFKVTSGDYITMQLVLCASHTQCQGGFDTEYMTFTAGSQVFKATMTLPAWDNDCLLQETSVYSADVPGFYDALVANNNTATITFDAPDLCLEDV